MAAERRNLFLYLTLACFLGIIAIFIFDGYVGIYDTIYVTSIVLGIVLIVIAAYLQRRQSSKP